MAIRTMSQLPSCTSFIEGPQPCCRFKFSEIMLATGNFDESAVIGHGGFGKVYKGKVYNGSSLVVVAIKRLDSMSSQGAAEFWAEVKLLSKLRHCNLVSLIGYCFHRKEMILVYEYMPNGTLEDHLHKLGTSLSWVQRLKICIGAGRGLHYLHTGTGIEVGVIHRDVKSSNVLLDESWAAKISDFGLSRISPINQRASYVNTLVKGTFGYLDPDYFYTGRLTRKSDVYAFGVVLLEVLCRKRAVDRSLDEDQWNLARWVQESSKERNLTRIIDTDIRSQISPKCLKEFVRIADRCLHSNPKERPTMAEVVVSLESLVLLQEKSNNSKQISGTKIFSRMVDMFAFANKAENLAHSDPKLSSSNNKQQTNPIPLVQGMGEVECRQILPLPRERPGNRKTSSNETSSKCRCAGEEKKLSSSDSNNLFLEKREESPAVSQISSPSLILFEYNDLIRATNNFSPDMLVGDGGFGNAFLAHSDLKLSSSDNSNLFPEKREECPADSQISSRSLILFEYNDLIRATNNFSPDKLVGDKGFGNTFLGWFDRNPFAPSKRGNGVTVAVKEYTFPSTAQGLAAVSLLERLDHPNIISLLGYCDDKRHGQLLVYEYVQNRNFDQLLPRDAPEPLSWETRLRIMIGVARGLAYLHASKVICHGLKSSDIWLDQVLLS
ncbi:Concanavalin A-like lectin/glucanase, subgroup [Artemisia annua]|uniref:Concanavalin A-like lectin/glucanase, subgroup n=1 Tax=Artemisia annua TaxID=35608 RepID=A0A2U1QIX5_ARTAN|nr:Concanavalin A-like lectin/glucanase, subgroup [Artemisia annua]